MTVRDLINSGLFTVLLAGDKPDTPVCGVFCCDLLSVAMSRGTEGYAWVTVMGNLNTLAVLTLTEMACLILAEGCSLDEAAAEKAREEGITVLASKEPVFSCALRIHELLNPS